MWRRKDVSFHPSHPIAFAFIKLNTVLLLRTLHLATHGRNNGACLEVSRSLQRSYQAMLHPKSILYNASTFLCRRSSVRHGLSLCLRLRTEMLYLYFCPPSNSFECSKSRPRRRPVAPYAAVRSSLWQ